MKACIYARTCSREKRYNTISIENQIEACLHLAHKHNVTVDPQHIFTDREMPGALPPTCWAAAGQEARPALSVLIEAVENGEVSRVIVRRMAKLGTASEVLMTLADFFSRHNVKIIAARDAQADADDPSTVFAISILTPCIQFDTEADALRRQQLRARRIEEIQRLREKMARLEAEVADLSD